MNRGARLAGRAWLALATVLVTLAPAEKAQALRPFDSTDADVAAAGELELEIGPLGLLRPRGAGDLLIAPAVIVNLGLTSRLELVLEGQHLYELQDGDRGARSRLVDNGVFLKGVARRGALQGEGGPSVALESGVLLPGFNDQPGWGLEGLVVLSLAGPAGMVHLNGVAAWTREHETELGAGLVLEGPASWRLRPVAETLYEKTLGAGWLRSVLAGAVWNFTESLALDVAGRVFDDGGERGLEVRMGLTWKMQLWNRSGR
jgi:hypothetical protein